MADTTTQLNSGAGGDKMSEQLVTQSDGVTQAKRPEVVIAGPNGFNGTVNDIVVPVAIDPGASPMALPVVPVAYVNDNPPSYIDGQMRSLSLNPEGRLRVVAVAAPGPVAFFNETESSIWDVVDLAPGSPWGDW